MKNKALFLVLTLSLMTSGLANFVSAGELTDDYFDIAANYFDSNNCEKALEYLDLILAIEPDNIDAKNLKNKIAPVKPSEADVIKETSKILSGPKISNHPADAASIEISTDNAVYDSEYYNTRGREFYSKQDFNNAIEYFHKAIVLDKKNAQAYNNLAMSYWLKNNTREAIKYFKKAHSVNKSYTQPLVNLSNLYKKSGNCKCQLYYLKKALKYNPNDYLAYYWLGDYYKNKEEYLKAIDNFKECIKINSKFPPVYLSLGKSFFEIEEFNYALIALNQYKEFYPDSDLAFYLMAKTHLTLCHYEEAKVYIEKALEINSCDEYRQKLAKIYYYLQNYDSALNILQDLLNRQESAEILNYAGLCYYKQKNAEQAVLNFQKAINIDGLRPIYYYNLAQCYKSTGDNKNYIKYMNIATKINPIHYQDFIDLSYIYYDNGNISYAINSLNNAISKYPDVKSLYLSKLKIYEALGDNLHYNETKDLIETRFNKR